MNLPQNLFTKRNIATFLIIGILVLSVPLGLRLSQSQKQITSLAAEGVCLDPTHMDHAPLYPISFYNVIEDSDDGACISKTHYTGEQPCGFIWKPDHGKLHIQIYDTSKIGTCPEQDKSFCSDAYYSVINDPLFPIAVALIDKMFRLDQTDYIKAVSNPELGGRGDDRVMDPTIRVAGFLGNTSGSFFHQLNPNNIHDPVEWLYDRGFWQRPASGPGSTPRPGVANPAATGRAFQEEYYGHYQKSFDNNPQGHKFMTSDRKSIIDWVKSHNLRQKNWTELACSNQPTTSNNSTCTSITAPDTIGAGQSFNVSVVMNNPSGAKAWNSSQNYRLGRFDNPTDSGFRLPEVNQDRVSLPSSPINPGSSVTFNFQVTTPNTAGIKSFELKMVQDGVEWFGGVCSKTMNITGSNTSPGPSTSPLPSSSSSASTSLNCDFNKDGKWDDKDFKIWVDEFTQQKKTIKADCTGDGKVDLKDFNKWRDEKLDRE